MLTISKSLPDYLSPGDGDVNHGNSNGNGHGMALTTLTMMTVAITIKTAITVGKDATIAADVEMALVVVAAAVENTVSMTVIVDHQEQARPCMTKITVDNNTNSYFSYNSLKNILTLAYILISTFFGRYLKYAYIS